MKYTASDFSPEIILGDYHGIIDDDDCYLITDEDIENMVQEYLEDEDNFPNDGELSDSEFNLLVLQCKNWFIDKICGSANK